MIILRIVCKHVGPFRESVELSTPGMGLFVVAAPNETGKSTLLRAATRALFDRHTTKDFEIKSLQPAGSDLAPSVLVELETQGTRYRIEKTFLKNPQSRLSQWRAEQWQLISEGDDADQRLQKLLHSSLPGRGASKPEHWGLLGFLWARQGEPTLWPDWSEGDVGEKIRRQLAQVEVDPLVDTLATRLNAEADDIFTATGQPRTGGPLKLASDERDTLRRELENIQSTRKSMENIHGRHHLALERAARLEKERDAQKEKAEEFTRQAALIERVQSELGRRTVECDAIREKLDTVRADEEAIASAARELEALRAGREALAAALLAEREKESHLRTSLRQCDKAKQDHESRTNALRKGIEQHRQHLSLRALKAELAEKESLLERAHLARKEIQDLTTQLNHLPPVDEPTRARLEELATLAWKTRSRLEAIGLTIELTPDRDTVVSTLETTSPERRDLTTGTTNTWTAPGELTLHLESWGRVRVHSGAEEPRTISNTLSETEAAIAAACTHLGVRDIDAARDAFTTRRDFTLRLDAAQKAQRERLGSWKSTDALATDCAQLQRRMLAMASQIPNDGDAPTASLEAALARMSEALPPLEKALASLNAERSRLENEIARSSTLLQEATLHLNRIEVEEQAHRSTIQARMERYPNGLEFLRAELGKALYQAQAACDAVRASLPPESERLPERNRRAATALQQLDNELLSARAERDQTRGALETFGGQGLYSRESIILEKLEETERAYHAAHTRGWAARITAAVLSHRKNEATHAALQPLEDRLTSAFAELSGQPHRRVFLNEQLGIEGIGTHRDSIHGFPLLSQGAREQLLLCLRVAVALELSGTETQTLLLDDVLVHTDPARQERVLDMLASLSERLQILLMTCHAERYRGVGTTVSISPITE